MGVAFAGKFHHPRWYSIILHMLMHQVSSGYCYRFLSLPLHLHFPWHRIPFPALHFPKLLTLDKTYAKYIEYLSEKCYINIIKLIAISIDWYQFHFIVFRNIDSMLTSCYYSELLAKSQVPNNIWWWHICKYIKVINSI